MGDVISTHLDESKREMITARTGEVLGEFGRLYEQQYAVALFNGVRFEIEGSGGPQPQLLHRKVPLEDRSIFSGALHLYLEENKKWRSRYLFVPDSYVVACYENQLAYERGLHPKGTLNCAGYRVLTSMDQYLELLNSTLPAVKAKAGSSPFLKCTTQFPLLLWHPYSRHHYFCASTEKEQQKWLAVFQDCIRHTNNGLSEESKVQTPAFTDAVRLLRQAHGLYGTWEMMCGAPPQILANLVMETLLPELRNLIAASLKGKLHERQRNWLLISDAVYTQVQSQTQARYEAVLLSCEGRRPQLEASIRTDMDQMITSKEHVASKIRAVVLPKAELLLKDSVQPYISSILEALMEPTSRGFAEVRDVLFRELVDMSKNVLNDGGKEKLGEHMEKISMLAFHPVKMQSCYEKVELLQLEGLQQRFDVSSPSVFVQRAQILMREQMDNAVYTFEQLLHQSLESQGGEDLCKIIQCAQDRVLKKYDYDSSTVRKKFFREALLQIFIPYMLKQLSPPCSSELSNFQELIFEDFSRFILVESIFEEVVLQSIMKDIMLAVKEAAVQRRHNLYRDSIVLTNSDPSLQLLGENLPIDWAGEYGSGEAELKDENHVDGDKPQKKRRVKQVVSMIQLDGVAPVSNESCLDVPGVDGIPEDVEGEGHPSPDNDTPAITNGTILQKEGEATAASTVNEVRVEKPGESPPQEAESRKTMESAPQEAESRKTMESAPQEAESRKTMESAPQEAESRKTIESAPQEAESRKTIESAPQEAESRKTMESAPQEAESRKTIESAPQEAESRKTIESAPQEVESRQTMEIPLQETEIKETTAGFIQDADSRSAIERAIQEIDSAVQGEEIDQLTESAEPEVTKPTPPSQQVEQPTPKESSSDKPPEMAPPTMDSTPRLHDNSSLQSLTNGTAEQAKGEPIAETSKAEDAVAQPQTTVIALEQGETAPHSDSATGEEGS